MYAAEILGWTSLPLDPREVHERGVERLAAINEERAQLAAELGYPDAATAIAAHTASGANTATEPEQLIALAEDQVRRSWEIAPTYFGRLPSANCEVRRVEEFREADEPMAFYYPPTDDGSRRRHLLHQLLRPRRPGAAPRRERDVPRGEPRPSLPARAAAGDA